jgi:hypothetical protein
MAGKTIIIKADWLEKGDDWAIEVAFVDALLAIPYSTMKRPPCLPTIPMPMPCSRSSRRSENIARRSREWRNDYAQALTDQPPRGKSRDATLNPCCISKPMQWVIYRQQVALGQINLLSVEYNTCAICQRSHLHSFALMTSKIYLVFEIHESVYCLVENWHHDLFRTGVFHSIQTYSLYDSKIKNDVIIYCAARATFPLEMPLLWFMLPPSTHTSRGIWPCLPCASKIAPQRYN